VTGTPVLVLTPAKGSVTQHAFLNLFTHIPQLLFAGACGHDHA
jgi:hypothetical protein